MPGVFLSHSSRDKAFARQLAIDLISRGFPVWYDTWQLEAGDSFVDGIYSAIDRSAFLLIVLSAQSIKSNWVKRELNAALSKEKELGSKFILPIRLDGSKLPAKLADRLYIDFSQSYLTALEQLESLLKRHNVDKVEIEPAKQIVPVTFTRGIYLREETFTKRVKQLFEGASEGFRLEARQFLIEKDDDYTRLEERLRNRIGQIDEDPYYSPELERNLDRSYAGIRQYENWLSEGIAMIINQTRWSPIFGRWSFSSSCHWFARLIRKQSYAELYACQRPDEPPVVSWNDDWQPDPLGTNHQAVLFFQAGPLTSVTIGLHGAEEPSGFFGFGSIISSEKRESCEGVGRLPSPFRVARGSRFRGG